MWSHHIDSHDRNSKEERIIKVPCYALHKQNTITYLSTNKIHIVYVDIFHDFLLATAFNKT